MLFIALCKATPAAVGERVLRRKGWKYPQDAQVVAEYWLQSPDPAVVVACEANHIGQLWTLFGGWNDIFDITIVPAISAQEGLELLKQRQREREREQE